MRPGGDAEMPSPDGIGLANVHQLGSHSMGNDVSRWILKFEHSHVPLRQSLLKAEEIRTVASRDALWNNIGDDR